MVLKLNFLQGLEGRGHRPIYHLRTLLSLTSFSFSNSDFIFSGDYPAPRFAQGAFTQVQLANVTKNDCVYEWLKYPDPSHN